MIAIPRRVQRRALRVLSAVTLITLLSQTSGMGFVLSAQAAVPSDPLVDETAAAAPVDDSFVVPAAAEAPTPVLNVDNPPLGASCGLDMGLVIDSSGSISSTELSQMKTAFKDFVDAFLPGTPTQMSVVEFDSTVIPPSLAFTSTIATIKNRIDAAVSGGRTNWQGGLLASHGLYDPRPAKPDLMVFASDGNPNAINGDDTVTEGVALSAAVVAANAIKTDGIRILALGIGNDLNVNNLKAISGPNVNTGITSDVITADFETLAETLAAFADDLCGGKVLVQKQFDTNGDGIPEYDGSMPNALLADWTFDVDGTPTNPDAQTTTDTGSLEFDVLNGTYSITEVTTKPGTTLASASCTKGNDDVGVFDPATRTVSELPMGTEETISCTFVNSATSGTLTVQKHVEGSNEPASSWQIHVKQNGADVPGSPQPGSETGTDYALAAGAYTVTETGPGGYTLSYGASCAGGNVTVVAGQATTCTLTNTRDTGSVMVHKKVDADGNGTFESSDAEANALGFRWALDSETPTRLMGTSATSVPTGNHTVSENDIADFHFVGWYPTGSTQFSCANPQGTTLPAALSVTKDHQSDITFCNARDTAELLVQKAVDTDGDGDVDVTDAQNWTWDLDGGNQNFPTGTPQVVTTGQHDVAEDNQDGYHNISWACWNTATAAPLGNGVGTELSVVVPLDGATCLFTNARDAGTLTVHKYFDDNGDGQTDRTNPQGWTWDLLGGSQNNIGGTTLLLPTGPYTVSEDAIADYTSTWNCSNQTSGNGTNFPVTIAANGQHIVCSFTNTRQTGTVIVHKYVDADGNGSFEGSDDQANVLGFDWALDAETPARDMGTSAVTLTGNHTVTESVIDGYTLVGWYPSGSTQYSCAYPQGTTLPVPITVTNGGTTQVTFCNRLNVTTIDLDKSAPGSVNAGDPITYTLTWSVGGNTAATNAVITDTIPADTSYLSATCGTTAGFCLIDDSTSTITWYLGVRNPGETGTVELTVMTDTPLTNGTVITNVADFDTDQTPPTSGDAKTTIVSAPTINFEKTGPSSVDAGDAMTYTLFWSIGGNAPATNVLISDTVPALTTYLPASANCNGTAGTCVVDDTTDTLTWDLGTRNPGDFGSVAFQVVTDSPLYNGTLITNTGSLDTTENDPLYDTVYTWVESDFGVHLEKSGPAVINAGTDMVYTLSWQVLGNSPVDSLVLTDPLPVNTTFVAVDNGGIHDGGNPGIVTWNLGAHVPGDMGEVTLTVHVASPLVNGTEITNTAELCGFVEWKDLARGDENPLHHCDEDSTTTTVSSSPILTVVKSDTPDPVAAGGQVTYTIDWAVSGNAPVTALTLTDTLPLNTTFFSANNGGTHNGGIPGVVTWALGNHVPGDAGSVTVTVTVASPLPNGTVLTNVATISSEELEPISDTETTTVVSAPILTISKSVSAPFANPGDVVTYSVTVTNTGNDAAINTTVTDVLHPGFTFAEGGAATKTFALGTMEKGKSVTFSYTVVVDFAVGAGTYPNVATAKADNHGPVSATANLEVRIPIVEGEQTPILQLEKIVEQSTATPGDEITYVVSLANIGNADAEDVRLTDTLPKDFTFADTGSTKRVWMIGTLLAGEVRTITYQVIVGDSAKAGMHENIIIATALGLDPLETRASIDIRVPQVKGALVETGAGSREYALFFLGFVLVCSAVIGLRRTRSLPMA